MRTPFFLLTLLYFLQFPLITRAQQSGSEQKDFPRLTAVALSAAVPGLGITKLRNGGPYWIIGVADYGCLVSGVLLNVMAISTYDKYKHATTASDRDTYYNRAKSLNHSGNILLYTAAGIWVADLIITAVIPAKIQAKISFGPGYDPMAKRPILTYHYNFGK
jgi:hypothetical protein